MTSHNVYLIVLSALFALVSVIMIHSLIRHRRAGDGTTTQFSGPAGTVQCLWALVPIAILASINCALIEAPRDRQAPAPKTIILAVAPSPGAPEAPAPARGPRSIQ